MFKLLNIFLLLSGMFTAIPAQDYESSGEDSVFTTEILVESNRLKMTTSLAPNKIQLIDENILSSLNGSRLPDALEFGDALFVKDYGFNSGIKTIALNSTQSEHTLVLLDGIRLNSRQNAQVDLSLYDLNNISMIEISKGGSSALYGSEAIGGVINLITRNPSLINPVNINFDASIGSYGYRRFFGRFANKVSFKNRSNIVYSISFGDERAKNFEYNFVTGTGNVLRERQNSDFNSQSFNFDASLIPGDKSKLRLFTNYSHFERGSPGIDVGYASSIARQIDYNSITSLIYSNTRGSISYKTDLTYKYSLQKYYDPATFNMPSEINSYYKLNGISGATTVSYSASPDFNTESGMELSFNNIESNETYEGELVQWGVFTSALFKIKNGFLSKVTFYPSVRYDYFSNIEPKNVITGKFGINIKPFDKSEISLKSSIGNNFSAPTFNELYWKDLGNRDLKPERSISFDAGLFYRFKFLAVNEFEFSYYNINTTDRIVWTPVSGIWRPINVGRVKSEGIDVSLQSNIIWKKNLNSLIKINYTYGEAIKKNESFPGDPSYGKQLIYLPKEMVKASFMFNYLTTTKLLKSLSFNIFYRFNTRRYTNFENTDFAPRFDVLDANISFRVDFFKITTDIKFIVNNVLSENYQPVPGYPMPPRNYRLELGFKY